MINKFLALAAVASMGVTISDTSRVGWLKGLVEGDVPLAIKEAFAPCYELYSTVRLSYGPKANSEVFVFADACSLESVTPVLVGMAESEGFDVTYAEVQDWLAELLIVSRRDNLPTKSLTEPDRFEISRASAAEFERVSWRSIGTKSPFICASSIQTLSAAEYCYMQTKGRTQLMLRGFSSNQAVTDIMIWPTSGEGLIHLPSDRISNIDGASFVWVDDSFVYELAGPTVVQVNVISGGDAYSKTFNMSTLGFQAELAGF